jgi:hypothetical protein
MSDTPKIPESTAIPQQIPVVQNPPRLSAKASRFNEKPLTEAEIEAAEEEALAWARRANSC